MVWSEVGAGIERVFARVDLGPVTRRATVGSLAADRCLSPSAVYPRRASAPRSSQRRHRDHAARDRGRPDPATATAPTTSPSPAGRPPHDRALAGRPSRRVRPEPRLPRRGARSAHGSFRNFRLVDGRGSPALVPRTAMAARCWHWVRRWERRGRLGGVRQTAVRRGPSLLRPGFGACGPDPPSCWPARGCVTDHSCCDRPRVPPPGRPAPSVLRRRPWGLSGHGPRTD